MGSKRLVTDRKLRRRPGDRHVMLVGDGVDSSCCCGGCPLWAQFRPCGTFDCDGTQTPSKGPPIWACESARCSNNAFSILGRPNQTIIIGGVCYEWTGLQVDDIALIPPGETILEDMLFLCGPGCGTAPCGATTGFAKAQPCHPSYPDLWFCKSQVPFCVTLDPSYTPNATTPLTPPCAPIYAGKCYTFNPTAPASQPPPGACIATFYPTFPFASYPRNCCQCGALNLTGTCLETSPLLSYDPAPGGCGLPFPPGCCGSTANARAWHAGRTLLEFDLDPRPFGPAPFLAERIIIEWNSTSNGGGTYSRKRWNRNNAGEPFILTEDQQVTIPPYAAVCPVPLLPPVPGVSDFIYGSRCPQNCQLPGGGLGTPIPPAFENRSVSRWSWSYRQHCPPQPGASGYNTQVSQATANLIGMDMSACGNNNCAGQFTPLPGRPIDGGPASPIGPAPATGSDGGTIIVRGGGSRVIDAQVVAALEAQSRLGGCRGCGDGWAG